MREDSPPDPFADDPADPSAALDGDPAADDPVEPLSSAEREEVLAELEDVEVFSALLEPRGVRGLVVECGDCHEPHYFGWALLRANLGQLLDLGVGRVHEPAYAPDPADYVSWDYAHGFADGVLSGDEDQPEADGA